MIEILRRLAVRSNRRLFDIRRLRRSRRGRLQGEIRRLTQFAYTGSGTGICRVLGRYKLFVDTQDAGMFPHLALDGYWELWVTEFLVSCVRPGMIAVDIGANVGYFTMVLADLVGPGGQVHAFEPNPDAMAHLRRSVHMNGFDGRVTLHPEPLGDRANESVALHIPHKYPGGATVVPAAEGAGGVLRISRLDGYPAVLDADIVKIDAEGSEHAIWRGMAGVFARGRAMTVLVEFVRARYADPAGFLAEMTGAGFSLNYVSAATDLQAITPAEILARSREEDIMLVLIRAAQAAARGSG